MVLADTCPRYILPANDDDDDDYIAVWDSSSWIVELTEYVIFKILIESSFICL